MLLSELVRDVAGARLAGADAAVTGVADDSRRVMPGEAFVAVRGLTVDGHRFARAAVERGAAALVVEEEQPIDVPQAIVPSGVQALGLIHARWLGRPADRLRLAGITGTNGKTTTTYLVEAMLAAAGRRPGVVGTVNARFAGKELPASFTTPAPAELQGVLAEMVSAATTDVVMEATSSALALERLAGLTFQVVAFSNLTQDHLDVHGTMEAYRDAKRRLFSERVAAGGTAVANIDDPAGELMLAAAPAGVRRLRVSLRGPAEISLVRASSTVNGIEAVFRTPRGELALATRGLFGEYNVANLGLAVGIAEALELPHEAVARGVAALSGVPGRVERVPNGRDLAIFVDYAHTPDALERVIAALRPVTEKRLICVFGCGGDRDSTKRPKMGAVVARDADVAIVTSDNPRTEEPVKIIDAIVAGMASERSRAEVVVEPDRRAAIGVAARLAAPGDVVLIAGKGHEDYQILGKTKIHFDDREEAAAAADSLLTLDEVLAATGGTLVRGVARAFGGVTIDGRSARRGDLYVAIQGERYDGHDFVAQARAAGAEGFLVARDVDVAGTVIRVDDPRRALGEIARAWRRRWGRQVVGVTGSTGKTTTKQLVAAMLSGVHGEGAVLATEGSLNNETGVPMTLLRLRPRHQVAVIEMGMRGVGQIDELTHFAEPEVGVVVNVGVAHVGVVGSVDAIADGKSEIWGRGARFAIFPHGDARLTARAARRPATKVTFGTEDGATVRLRSVTPRGVEGSDVVLEIGGRSLELRVPLVGRHNADNAACAMAVAVALGVDLEAAARGIAGARAASKRGEIAEIAGRHVLIDCYNANPASMRAALETVTTLAAGRGAVAVLGDMLELGGTEEEEHRSLGMAVAKTGALRLITLGERAREIARGARDAGLNEVQVVNVDNVAGAARLALSWTEPGDWILVKASRGMRLERVVDALREPGGE